MFRIVQFFPFAVLFLTVAYATAWGTLALWYKLPGPNLVVGVAAVSFGIFGISTLIAFFTSLRWRWFWVFGVSLVALNVWWNTLVPPADGNWTPDVARQVTGTIDGDILTLHNVRAFNWRTVDDFDENWVTRTYDLSQTESADLFMSYWAGPEMAHFMVSFGFANGDYLTWSMEVRREVGSSFSPTADFFKAHTIAVIAAEERDIVGLRSNIKKERVQIFRGQHDPNDTRLIEAYVAAANEVAEKPRWFNSVFTNCSRSVIMLARHVGIKVPFDYRVIVNGYFPNFLYDHGKLNSDVSIEELYHLGDITERALANGLTDNFSTAIRKDVPMP
ncbi:hypothetical protein C1J03_06890 [Sulfitobacter sp. SK012]|uniref:lipoprotein N-acyltransferase Lnb domain-containing protein n=1 Tax=Sulfitobacter sp. SK012 TaxID=1389005 RepID=UPI000E0C277B|nr:DUF4105 domain-containing protein [Sulfitobacter sp. SK012]AXI48792.1 hypothetical protein C1J03_06890 [Sulfitobacter sp. SK012]